MDADATTMLWLGVVLVGAFHGLNPAMGWPLAVANGLTEQRGSAVWATFWPLGLGHLLAMALVLLPFALLSWVMAWNLQIRVGAGLLVMLFGLLRLVWRRHPRWVMRVRPTQLVLWSLLMATAHGAALMLVPIVMGLCTTPADDTTPHGAVMALMQSDLGTALAVSLLHTAAMMVSGLGAAWLVYRHLGLRVLRSAWFDLDTAWALGLMLSGAAAVALALRDGVGP